MIICLNIIFFNVIVLELLQLYETNNYIPRRKSGIYWIQVRRAAAAVEISLWTR